MLTPSASASLTVVPDAGVRTRLLDLDDHAAADPGAGGEGVQGEAALAAPALEVAGERLRELVEVRHISVQYSG